MRSHIRPPSVSFKDTSVVPCVGPSSVQIGPKNLFVGSSLTIVPNNMVEPTSLPSAPIFEESIVNIPEQSSKGKDTTSYVPYSILVWLVNLICVSNKVFLYMEVIYNNIIYIFVFRYPIMLYRIVNWRNGHGGNARSQDDLLFTPDFF